ncbi:MAG: 50S ribosomal protein L23 [Planctomycetes bacterium]|nr:50S ribosomal protein L23 [Planctomycetota bacterium]
MNKNHEIIQTVVLTEASYALGQQLSTFIFKVARGANKVQIRSAIEKAFGVRVLGVNTLSTAKKTKPVRGRAGAHTVRLGYKKAFVKIHPDDAGKIPLI